MDDKTVIRVSENIRYGLEAIGEGLQIAAWTMPIAFVIVAALLSGVFK